MNKKIIKIMIAEDSRLTVVGLRTMLEEQKDFNILGIAENGQIAVEMATKLNPDIVLMDIGMPIIDGIQATKLIKQSKTDIKIIMLTSHEDENEVFEAFAGGANSYCMKDIEPEEFVNVIRSTYNGAVWLDPRIAGFVLKNINNQPQKQKNNELTEREIEILKLISKGLSNNKISEELFISMNTVKTHLKNIFAKLGVEDRTHAVMKALKSNLLNE